MQQAAVKLQGALNASGDLMHHPKPCTLTPEPYILSIPALKSIKSIKSVNMKLNNPKVKNLPTQVEEQE